MIRENLERHFNFSSFLPGQEDVIKVILAGKDVVALMPTGGGKSLCFQLPSIIKQKLTVVVSPLIALMKDQVDALQARGIPAGFLNSSQDPIESDRVMAYLRSGQIKILYIAPERLQNRKFVNFVSDLDIDFLAVDEAHCVSQWGHDFRPDYLLIKDFVNNLKTRPTIGAFTATATSEVRDDIVKNLELNEPQVFVRGFDRPNLKFFVQKNLGQNQRKEEVGRIIKTQRGSGIVYAISRKETEQMAEYLNEQGIRAVAYHAGMNKIERSKIQDYFMENRYKVIVATIAFGMGVDKADIRFVIHAGMPSTLESYYQEAGRAGRDGEDAYCILLHSGRDGALHKFFIKKSREEMERQKKPYEEIRRICNIKYDRLEKINNYVESVACRRKAILNYFSDPSAELMDDCEGCDICLDFKWENATPKYSRKKTSNRPKELITNTVMETVKLYQKDYEPEKIAKIRSLGVRTVFSHLARWYEDGGDFYIRKFVSEDNEAEVKRVVDEFGDIFNIEKLKPIKEKVSDAITYEQIKLVMAGLRRKAKNI